MQRHAPVRNVKIEDIRAAARRVGPNVEHTPCLHSHVLSARTGAQVFLKFENLQFTSSFKERGALNKLLSLTEAQRKRGVIAASAGNHAQAVAHHARRLHIRATIVMPQTTPFAKVSNTEVLGAEVLLVGDTLSQALEHARELAVQREWTMVHPYDDPLVIAGQGTVALEMLAEANDLDDLLVPCGGGGLLAGVALASKAVSPKTRVIGVQVERHCALHDWFHGKKASRKKQESADTLAEGIAVKDPSELTRRYIKRHVDDVLKVSEQDIEDAINELVEHEKTVVEGAGAAGLAALLGRRKRFAGRKVGCILSGGNIDSRILAETIQRGLARSGRLSRLQLVVRDLPGALAKLAALVAAAGANIVDIRHQRVFSAAKARTELELEVATRDRKHARRVVAVLRDAGYAVQLMA